MKAARSAWVGLLAAAGCAGIIPIGKTVLEQLSESVEAYNHAFRWKTYDQAALYLPEDVRPGFLAAYEDDESSLQIEDYQIARIHMKDDKSAEVTVKMRYMMLPSLVVQKATLHQYWHNVAGRWIMETEDGSIRTIDPSKTPRAGLRRAPEVTQEQEGMTEVDVERPGDPPRQEETPPPED